MLALCVADLLVDCIKKPTILCAVQRLVSWGGYSQGKEEGGRMKEKGVSIYLFIYELFIYELNKDE